ncbi:MAG: hypothetical protein JWO03_613 [Bacteroidetes bacterium]|nr:hypothetical protein [Bacteroidota bacterium]
MKKTLLLFSIVFMITSWYSCTKDHAPAVAKNTGSCDSTKVNFTKDVLPIINTTCLGSDCHDPGTPQLNFAIYSVAKADGDNILCRIQAPGTTFCGARMPQGLPPLDSATKAIFVNWKAGGYYDCQ